MSREGALWIGGLEPYMDEEFLMAALKSSGENNVISIKVIKNKFTGQVAGYGFVNFASDEIALMCMHKLNGKIIPNSRPPARYKLNHNSNRLLPGEKNHSIWVGDLDQDIDDLQLYKFFAARFQTIISAKIVLDEAGASKGFGFVRFNNETEQQTALHTMQGISGLGSRPIKVSIAVQKAKDPTQLQAGTPSGMPPNFQPPLPGQPPMQRPPTATTGYTGAQGYDASYYNQYNNYWSNMAAWQQYNQYYQGYPGASNGAPPPNGYGTQQPPMPTNGAGDKNGPTGMEEGGDLNGDSVAPGTTIYTNSALQFLDDDVSILDGPLNQPVDHSKPIDYYKLNRRYFSSSADLYDALDESGWGSIEDTI